MLWKGSAWCRGLARLLVRDDIALASVSDASLTWLAVEELESRAMSAAEK